MSWLFFVCLWQQAGLDLESMPPLPPTELIEVGETELTLKCKFKVLIEPMNNPLGISPSKGNQGTTRGKEKSFDLSGNRTHNLQIRFTITLLTELRCRTEKVGMIKVVNCGEERVRVHMNVVPCSTMNTNGETEN